jgi:hypothetical protein
MGHRWSGFVAAAVSLLVVSGCRSYGGAPTKPLPNPQRLEVAGAHVHAPSGMTFPEEVAGFARSAVTRYDEEGRNVSVGYDLVRPDSVVSATVYVYPSPACSSFGGDPDAVRAMKATLAEGEYAACREEVRSAHAGARVTAEGAVRREHGGATLEGRRAAFEYEGNLGGWRVPCTSELLVFCYVDDAWTVKYRITRPSAAAAAGADVERFLREFAWTLPAK